jgi:hypothetical protein
MTATMSRLQVRLPLHPRYPLGNTRTSHIAQAHQQHQQHRHAASFFTSGQPVAGRDCGSSRWDDRWHLVRGSCGVNFLVLETRTPKPAAAGVLQEERWLLWSLRSAGVCPAPIAFAFAELQRWHSASLLSTGQCERPGRGLRNGWPMASRRFWP